MFSLTKKLLTQYQNATIETQRKAEALLYVIVISLFFLALFLLYIFYTPNDFFVSHLLLPILISLLVIFIISFLFLIRGKLDIAGDIFSLLPIIFIQVIALWQADTIDYSSILFGINMFLLVFFVSGLTFSTKPFIYFNFFIILISTWILYFIFKNGFLEEYKNIYLRGTLNYTLVLILLFLVVINSKETISKILLQLFNEKERFKSQSSQLAKEKERLKYKSSQLEKLVTNILESIERLAIENEGLVKLSNLLSGRVNEQAAATEEISSSTEEMSASLENSVEYVKFTNESARQVNNEVKQSAKNLEEVFGILRGIAERIGLITEIADKTDMLAINAAIEAAHAGENGRGFAVVAKEIRKLADVSKGFAKEITALVNKNIVLSEDMEKRFNTIVGRISEITEKISIITSSTQELLQTINVINISVVQLSQAAVENATVVERLVGHTNNLDNLAKNLRLSVK